MCFTTLVLSCVGRAKPEVTVPDEMMLFTLNRSQAIAIQLLTPAFQRDLDDAKVEALRAMPERARFSKGLYAWIGFRSIGVPFEVAERAFGESKFSYRKLTRFALDGLMSFSTLPLMVWTYVGTLISIGALAMAVYFIMQTITVGADVPGYASLIVSIMFFSGVQLMSLGILGEYVGRIFAEVKRRPLYLVAERVGVEADSSPIGRTRKSSP